MFGPRTKNTSLFLDIFFISEILENAVKFVYFKSVDHLDYHSCATDYMYDVIF